MPYVVILTGSIASGKSTAIAFFKQQSIDVMSADVVARELTAKNTPGLQAMAAHFGQNILTADGTLNRNALRQIIVKYPSERRWLEAYLHPQIRRRIAEQLKHSKSPYVVIEIPLLTKREDFPYLNHVLLLEVEKTEQIKRLMARDQCTHEEALQMIKIQPNPAIRRALADDVVKNDGHPVHFETELKALHTQYLKASQEA